MTFLAVVDVGVAQAEGIAGVGGHLHDYLHVRGIASKSGLIHEAERWVPGDSAIDWDSSISAIVTWGVRHGDLAASGNEVRILPAWALGPYRDSTNGDWVVRLHGAVSGEQLAARDITTECRPTVDDSGLGVGRVTVARGSDLRVLLGQLEDSGLPVRQWPAPAAILLRREPPKLGPFDPPPGKLEHLRLRKAFGGFSWQALPSSSDQELSLIRVTADDSRGTRSYFLSRGRESAVQIPWSEAVSQVWRMQIRTRSLNGQRVLPHDIVRATPNGVDFVCGAIPTLLEQCVCPYDESSDVAPRRSSFTLTGDLPERVTSLVEQFLEALQRA